MAPSTTTAVAGTAVVVAAAAVVAVVSAKSRRKPVFITKNNIAQFMTQIDAVVSDCDGVIWTPTRSHIPHAKEGLESLKAAGKKVLFVTNNSVIPPLNKFERFGFAVKKEDVVHPALALTRHLRQIGFKKKAFVIGVENFKDELRRGGIRVIPEKRSAELVEEKVETVLQIIKEDSEIGAVIVDLDVNINYVEMVLALNHLRSRDCLFFAGATDATVTFEDGRMILGPGVFLEALEGSSGRKATRIGKPGPMMVDEFLKDVHKLDLKRTVFIGDSLVQDMGIANVCGMKKLLVLSGVTQMKDLSTCDPKHMPDFIIDSVGHFAQLLDQQERPQNSGHNVKINTGRL